MTDDRNQLDDDRLDARIRSLVATAVADAPPAPRIDETICGPVRSDRERGNRRWVAGGLAGLSAAAAIVALFLISRPEEVSAPVIPATQPPTIPAAPTVPTATVADEMTEDALVEVDPTVPTDSVGTAVTVPAVERSSRFSRFGTGSSVVTGAGPTGVVVDVWPSASEQLIVSSDAMAVAIAAPDGRVYAQRSTDVHGFDFGDPDETRLLVWADRDADTDRVPPREVTVPPELATARIKLHDLAVIADELVLLIETTTNAPCPNFENCVSDLWAFRPDTLQLDLIASESAFEEGWVNLALADSGLIVGTRFASISDGIYSAIVPGSSIDPVSAPALGLEDWYEDCGNCPTAYTVDRTGHYVVWTQAGSETPQTTITVRSVVGDYRARIELLDADGPVDIQAVFGELVVGRIDIADDGTPIGLAAINRVADNATGERETRTVSLATGETTVSTTATIIKID